MAEIASSDDVHASCDRVVRKMHQLVWMTYILLGLTIVLAALVCWGTYTLKERVLKQGVHMLLDGDQAGNDAGLEGRVTVDGGVLTIWEVIPVGHGDLSLASHDSSCPIPGVC
jgi:hypothetical protein